MIRPIQSAEGPTFPRVPLARKRWRLSFGLTALFATVTAVAVLAGAAKMPAPLGVLFAIDALTFSMGLYYVRLGVSLYGVIPLRLSEDRCAWVHIGFGLLLAGVAGLTFGAVAIMNR